MRIGTKSCKRLPAFFLLLVLFILLSYGIYSTFHERNLSDLNDYVISSLDSSELLSYIIAREAFWKDVKTVLFRDIATVRAGDHPDFSLLGPIGPTCPQFDIFGSGDQEKRACLMTPYLNSLGHDEECVIISLGSKNWFAFEEAFIAEFPHCHIHVFDCTVDPKVPLNLKDHITFHEVCISNASYTLDNGWQYVSWGEAISLTGSSRPPFYLKMDIEGFEWQVFETMLTDGRDGSNLPDQIAFELHTHKKSRLKVTLLMQSLFEELGYALLDRNDNVRCQGCSELLLARIYK